MGHIFEPKIRILFPKPVGRHLGQVPKSCFIRPQMLLDRYAFRHFRQQPGIGLGQFLGSLQGAALKLVVRVAEGFFSGFFLCDVLKNPNRALTAVWLDQCFCQVAAPKL
jgi:hypothetical protein